MMGATHRTGSIALSTTMEAFLPLATLPAALTGIMWLPSSYSLIKGILFVVFSEIGGLLPDADMPQSTIGRRFWLLFLPLYLLRHFFNFLGLVIKPFRNIGKAMGHRGIFHSPLLWTLFFALFCAFKSPGAEYLPCIVSGLYFGILSHLLLDFLSGGLPLLAPFSMKRFRPSITMKTGSGLEVVLNIVFVFISIFMVYFMALHFKEGLTL